MKSPRKPKDGKRGEEGVPTLAEALKGWEDYDRAESARCEDAVAAARRKLEELATRVRGLLEGATLSTAQNPFFGAGDSLGYLMVLVVGPLSTVCVDLTLPHLVALLSDGCDDWRCDISSTVRRAAFVRTVAWVMRHGLGNVRRMPAFPAGA